MTKLDDAKAVFVISHDQFRDEEYEHPRRVLEEKGVQVRVASSVLGPARGKLGLEVQPDILIDDVKVDDFDIVAFIGGGGSAEYFDSAPAHDLARDTVAKHKILAAICIAPGILARAGVLEGKRATTFPSEVESLQRGGARCTSNPVERDGWLVTANGPEAAAAFGRVLAEVLVEQKTDLEQPGYEQ